MSDLPDLSQAPDERRCPSCDTVVAADATVCLMCGTRLAPVNPLPPKPTKGASASTRLLPQLNQR
jgi:hypothetical protein